MGEYVKVFQNLEAEFGNGRDRPVKIQFSCWDDTSEAWRQLLLGDVGAVRQLFDPTITLPRPAPNCARCGTAMQAGFVPHGTTRGLLASEWYAGTMSFGAFGTVKVPDSSKYTVTVYRCPTCGRLEFFAID